MPGFDEALPVTLANEGGKVDNPADPGGRTNQGVIQRNYDAWRRSQGLPTQDVYLMTDDERDAIYRTYWDADGTWRWTDGAWDAGTLDGQPWPIALYAFDAAVQHGVTRAQQWLTDSGGDPVQFLALRQEFLDQWVAASPSRQQFARGFANRITKLSTFLSTPAAQIGGGVIVLSLAALLFFLRSRRKQ